MRQEGSHPPPRPPAAAEPPDDDLVEQIRQGQSRALEALIRRFEGRVYGFLLRMLGSPADAEDLTQEVFLRMCTSLSQYQCRGRFAAWLFTIARNRCRTQAEKRARDRSLVAGAVAPETVEAPGGTGDPATKDGIGELLECLPEDHRRVMVLKYVADLTCEEIGRIEEISEAAVRQRLHRARLMIRDRLGGG